MIPLAVKSPVVQVWKGLLKCDASAVKATGGAKIVSLVGDLDATRGKAMIAFGWAVAEELAAGSYLAAS